MTRPRFLPLLTALTIAAAAAAVPSAAAAAHPAGTDVGPGTVMLIGGALDDNNSAVYGEFVRQAVVLRRASAC